MTDFLEVEDEKASEALSVTTCEHHLLTGTSCASMSSPNHSQSVALLETSFIPCRGWISRKKAPGCVFVRDVRFFKSCKFSFNAAVTLPSMCVSMC